MIESLKDLKHTPVVLSLLIVNILLFIAQFLTQGLVSQLGVLYGPAVQQGQVWRLLSSGFLHGSILHIAFNMYMLFAMGQQLERHLGGLRFALIYLGSLFGGTLAVMLFSWQQPTLGASAAVLGLAGAMGLHLHRQGIKPQQSPFFGLVILNLALPLLVPGISFWGHFGGIVAGGLMGYLIIGPPRSLKQNQSTQMAIGTIVLLAVLSLFVAQTGGL